MSLLPHVADKRRDDAIAAVISHLSPSCLRDGSFVITQEIMPLLLGLAYEVGAKDALRMSMEDSNA